MKKSVIVLLLFTLFLNEGYSQDLKSFFKDADAFFATNVKDNKIMYQSVKDNPATLKKLTDFVASADVKGYSEAELKAFYINAYNLLVVKNVVDHYPIKKPLDVEGFFDAIKHTVGGKKTTLNNFEKKELLNKYKDARLHFVLVCAAVSCPPIANYAYMPDKLEEQLEERTKAAINDPTFIRADDFAGKLEISKIFEWYVDDFKPNVKTFINKYKEPKLEDAAKLNYYPYDWTLNDVSVSTGGGSNSSASTATDGGDDDFAPVLVGATMPKGKFEIQAFNSLFTANYGDKENGSRSSYFSSLINLSYGLTGRFDIGLDFIVKSFRANDLYNSSPFRALEFKNSMDSVTTPGGTTRPAIWGSSVSHLGPRVRFAPFKKFPLAFEQAFYFPINNLPTNIDPSITWVTQIFYDKQFNPKLGLFIALTFWQPLVVGQKFKFQVPYLKAFFSWYATSRFTMYATTTSFTEWGAGAKFLITPKFEIQAMYTYYVPIPGLAELYTGTGAKNVMTFNIGIRYRTSIVSKNR